MTHWVLLRYDCYNLINQIKQIWIIKRLFVYIWEVKHFKKNYQHPFRHIFFWILWTYIKSKCCKFTRTRKCSMVPEISWHHSRSLEVLGSIFVCHENTLKNYLSPIDLFILHILLLAVNSKNTRSCSNSIILLFWAHWTL